MNLTSRLLLLFLAFSASSVFAQVEYCYDHVGIPVYCDRGSTDLKIKPEHITLFANAVKGANGAQTWCFVGQNCQAGQAWFNGPKMQAAHTGSVTAYIHFYGGSDWCQNTAARCDGIRQRTYVANFQLVVGGEVRAQVSIDPSTIKMEPGAWGGFYFAPAFQDSPIRIGGKLVTLGTYVKAGEEISVIATSIGQSFELNQVEIKTLAE